MTVVENGIDFSAALPASVGEPPFFVKIFPTFHIQWLNYFAECVIMSVYILETRKECAMTRFENKLCPVCKTRFVENADIVVCPTCGTPHHRSCYSIKNKCELEELHADGWTWNGLLPDQEKEREEMLKGLELPTVDLGKPAEEIRRTEFSPDKPRAPYEEEQRMFEEQLGDDNPFKELFKKLSDKEIGEDGVSMHELMAFSATSVYHYGKAFDLFRGSSGKKRKVSLNLSSGLFAPMFQGYRKMNVFGVISLLLLLAPSLAIAVMPERIINETGSELLYLLQFANVLIRILLCVFGDYIYYRHCISRIKRFRQSYDGDTRSDDYFMALYECGKPTLAGAAIGCLAMMFGYAGILYLAG